MAVATATAIAGDVARIHPIAAAGPNGIPVNTAGFPDSWLAAGPNPYNGSCCDTDTHPGAHPQSHAVTHTHAKPARRARPGEGDAH